MALSITSITPATGFTAGKTRVVIEGTNFDYPPFPPTQPGYIGNLPPTLEVRFGVLPATNVWVYPKPGGSPGETVIECSTPRYVGMSSVLPASVDVTVENLVIPGTVTAVGGFQYRHQDVKQENILARVFRSLLSELARQIPVRSVCSRVHTDFDGSVGDGLNSIKISELPAMYVLGPHISRSAGIYRRPNELCATGEKVFLSGTYVDATFRIAIIDESEFRILNLMNLLINFVDENGRLAVENVAGEPLQGFSYYDMDWEGLPDLDNTANNNNLMAAEGSLVVRGIRSSRVNPIEIEKALKISGEVNIDLLPGV